MQALRDQNSVTTMLAVSAADGVTPIVLTADPVSHALDVEEASLSYSADAIAHRDQNFVPTLLAVSNADGITPVVLYADPLTGELLIHNI